MSSKEDEAIFTLNDKPLKFFTYLNINISSTESDVNLHRKGMDCYQWIIKYIEIQFLIK